jgi:hypothetical protein
MHGYAGNPASYPPNVPLVDDSDSPNAANFTAAQIALADRSAYINANFLSSAGGTFIGVLSFASGAKLAMLSGSVLELDAGSQVDAKSGSTFLFEGGTYLEFQSGATIRFDAGANMDLSGPAAITAEVAGAIQARASGAMQSLVAGGIQLADGSPTNTALGSFGNPRTKSTSQPLILTPYGLSAGWTGGGPLLNPGIVFGPSGGGTAVAQIFALPYTHDGATLASVILKFQVTDIHSGGIVGIVPPSLNIIRFDLLAGFLPQQASLGGGAHALSLGGSSTAWYDLANVQSYVYTCTSNNVVDNSRFQYFAVVTDENSGAAVGGNAFYGFVLNHTNILDTRFPM